MSTTATVTSAPWGRVGVAMVTPFDATGGLDVKGLESVVDHLLASGHDLIVVNGTTGESPTTSDAEKTSLVEQTVALVAGRASVMAGVGSADTRHTVELAREAARAGADGLLVVTPYYSRPTQAGLIAHFTAVADATDLPCMLYDIPGRTGTAIATETLLRLAEHPHIAAVKDAKGDIAGTTALLAGSDLAFYSGSDENNLAWLAIGAVGVVSVVSHVAGKQYAAMIAAVDAGDLATARAIDRSLVPAVRAIMMRVPGAVAAKAALVEVGVLADATVRLPQVPMTEADLALLRADLAASGLL
jgi:4-hydroxy-tetrahydrodipicolinate synthase